ncbi:MAG: motility associated factor glycosyltransferase family protein [Brevinematia bacterium]
MIDFVKLNELSKTNQIIEKTKNNLFTIKLNQNYVHSIYDPYKEAERLIKVVEETNPEETLVIIFGSGLGYHIELLEKKGYKNVIIIELNDEIYRIFKNIYDLPETYFLLSLKDKVEKIDSIFSIFEIQNFKRIKTIQLRNDYSKELYKPYEERIQRLLEVKLGDFSTRMKFEEIWFINILKNIYFLKNSVEIQKLFGLFKNLPFLIVSAGPSLKDSLEYIKKIKDYVILVSVDTAILPLYEAGIIPDFIYSLDSQIYNLTDFLMIEKNFLSKTNLIYDIVSNPGLQVYFNKIRKENPERYNFISTTAHLDFDYNNNPFFIKNEFVNWIENKVSLRFGDIETGGSVSTSAFHFSFLAGGNPIILTGQDLAYTNLVSHTPSSSHFYRLLSKTNRVNKIENLFLSIIKKRKILEKDSLNKNKILTDFVLNNFRGWFEESAKNILNFQKNISLINATLNGTKISHFTDMPIDKLSQIISKEGTKLDKERIFKFSLIEVNKIDKILWELKKLDNFVLELPIKEEIFSIIENSEFYFLNRYFMKERIVFERYSKFEEDNIHRKLRRLVKNLEELYARKTD